MTDGVIVLDKPEGMTSFRAVETVSRLLGRRKCGHAGTLDPMATGVLPVCVGRATKIAAYIAMQDKEYDASFRFGVATDTGDVTGREVEARPGAVAAEDVVSAAVAALVGAWEQVPPDYSAVKVGGTRAYALARRGEAVALAPRRVTVTEAKVLAWSPGGFRLVLTCSKGFYVRALSRDLGRALGVPMAVSALRRLRCGPFRVADAVTLDALRDAARRGEAGGAVLSISRALAGFPQFEVPADAVAAVRQGRSPGPWLAGRGVAGPQPVVLLTHGAEGAVALVGRGAAGEWTILRGL
ncbi:MAG: tRNA pseudouridine(55) synthase TruB [Gemmatimonadota bacterium]